MAGMRDWFERSIQILEAVADESGEEEHLEDLALSLHDMGISLDDTDILQRSFDIYKKLCDINPQNSEYAEMKDEIEQYLEEDLNGSVWQKFKRLWKK